LSLASVHKPLAAVAFRLKIIPRVSSVFFIIWVAGRVMDWRGLARLRKVLGLDYPLRVFQWFTYITHQVLQAFLFDASKPSDSIKPWNRGTADDFKYNRTVAYFSIVRPVFPLKTGDLMFVGFDSQNTSYSFPHYPNWNLWVWWILLIGFRGWSEK
jgi:hypothetical protein